MGCSLGLLERQHANAGSHRNQSESDAGKAVIGGTRITVELILRKLGEGASHSELLEAYPNLTENDVQAAIFFGVQAS
jgi:uncharacterized protein (DUF433 family)